MRSMRGTRFPVLFLVSVVQISCINSATTPGLARATQARHTIDIAHLDQDQRPIIRREGALLLGGGMELHSAVGGVIVSSKASAIDPDSAAADAALAHELDVPENVQERDPELFEEMTCPGEWREMVGFQKPFLCPTVMKKTNCSWTNAGAALASICKEDCFCSPAALLANSTNASTDNASDDTGEGDANDFNMGFYEEDENVGVSMDIQQCKMMCKDTDPCYFTYITDEVGQNGQCRVYTECKDEDKEKAPPDLADPANGNVWKTCERFFGNYTDRTIALHSPEFNRFVEVNKDGGVQSTIAEIDISMRSNITAAMSFIVTGTGNISEINRKGDETVEDVEEDENMDADEVLSLRETQELGGPGTIALYVQSAHGKGLHWMTINNQGAIVGEQRVSANSLFTVCYLGPGEIALFNPGTMSYVQMTRDGGMQSTARSTCCKPPQGVEGLRFSVVTMDKVDGAT